MQPDGDLARSYRSIDRRSNSKASQRAPAGAALLVLMSWQERDAAFAAHRSGAGRKQVPFIGAANERHPIRPGSVTNQHDKDMASFI